MGLRQLPQRAGDWEPVCSNCGGFDTLELARTAPNRRGALARAGGERLPLIAGAAEPEPVVEVMETASDEPPRAPPDEAGFVAEEAKK